MNQSSTQEIEIQVSANCMRLMNLASENLSGKDFNNYIAPLREEMAAQFEKANVELEDMKSKYGESVSTIAALTAQLEDKV